MAGRKVSNSANLAWVRLSVDIDAAKSPGRAVVPAHNLPHWDASSGPTWGSYLIGRPQAVRPRPASLADHW